LLHFKMKAWLYLEEKIEVLPNFVLRSHLVKLRELRPKHILRKKEKNEFIGYFSWVILE